MVGPLGQYRSGPLQTEPPSAFPASFPVEIEWGLGNELLICAPAASVAASDGAIPGRSDDRHDDVAGRGSAVVSVTWADTSSFHRQIAAGVSSLYGRLQAAIAVEMAEEAEDAEIDELRERWRHVSRWSRHVSRLLSPPSAHSTLAAARASPHSLGISAADPFAAIDAEEEWDDESVPRGISQGELAAVWDLLRLCFLPDHTPGAADVDSDMDTRMGGGADVDTVSGTIVSISAQVIIPISYSSPPSSFPPPLPRSSAAASSHACQHFVPLLLFSAPSHVLFFLLFSPPPVAAPALFLHPPSPSLRHSPNPFASLVAQYNASLPPCNTSTSARLRSLRDQMSQSEVSGQLFSGSLWID
ncbi:unnamed protein product [Closterium sp. Naga37s-1]|nr:unnamed protein product [Closterium sp. Naga37s-1]